MSPATEAATTEPTPQHVLQELGFATKRASDGTIGGSAPIVPEMHLPGTSCLRTSILATWVDTVGGLIAVDVVAPRVPVTLELAVHLYRPLRDVEWVHATGHLIKAGRSIIVATVDLTDEQDGRLAFGTASFMVTPSPDARLPENTGIDRYLPGELRLRQPLAERVGLEVPEPGVAVLPSADDRLNAAQSINGGLLGLVVEEAALSLSPGSALQSLSLHYLQAVRVGPAVARADVESGLGHVEVRDAGNDERPGILATTRAAPL